MEEEVDTEIRKMERNEKNFLLLYLFIYLFWQGQIKIRVKRIEFLPTKKKIKK